MKESPKRPLNKPGMEQVPTRPCSQECCLLWDCRLTNELFAELGTQWRRPLTFTHAVWGALKDKRRKTCPLYPASLLYATGQMSLFFLMYSMYITLETDLWCLTYRSTKHDPCAAELYFVNYLDHTWFVLFPGKVEKILMNHLIV